MVLVQNRSAILLVCLCSKLLKTILHEAMDICALLFLLALFITLPLNIDIVVIASNNLVDFLVREFLDENNATSALMRMRSWRVIVAKPAGQTHL